MKKLKWSFIAVALAAALAGCSSDQRTPTRAYPLFWTWLDYRPAMNFDSVCRVMHETGIDGVMLNAPTPDDYRHAIGIARRYGIEVYAWLWTLNLEHDRDSIVRTHPEWLCVNRNGHSLADHKAYVDYYKFMCPALPEVRAYLKNKVKAYCEVEGLNGIAIDYHRLVDVILPTTLWPRYGIVQDKEYAEWDYGYHPAMLELFRQRHGYDPREQDDPSTDLAWRQFRCDQVTEAANEIAEVVHAHGKVMAASPFPTPSMSRSMVRQDWGKWQLDVVFPMVYHNFYTDDVSFISDCTRENVRQKHAMTTLYCGMMATDGPEMFSCMDAALDNGAQGIAIFTIQRLRTPEVRAQFKAYTDRIRAMRRLPQVRILEADTDPLYKPYIMNGVRQRIAALLALAHAAAAPGAHRRLTWAQMETQARAALQASTPEAYAERLASLQQRTQRPEEAAFMEALAGQPLPHVHLDEFRLQESCGATQRYYVMDLASEVTFNVYFYFHGGILSGWDVAPADPWYSVYRSRVRE